MSPYTATIVSAERLSNSRSGNPRYMLHLDSGQDVLTQSDAAVNYTITNPENIGVPVLIDQDQIGGVISVTPLSDMSSDDAELAAAIERAARAEADGDLALALAATRDALDAALRIADRGPFD